MKGDSSVWIFLIFSLLLIRSSLQCFRNYVPDANTAENDIDQFGTTPRDDSLQCECGVKSSSSASDEYPWAVMIKRLNPPKICGGSIVNDLVVVTSVSCLLDTDDLSIKENLLKRTQVNINNIEVHRQVSSGTFEALKIQSIECHPRAVPTLVLYRNSIDIDACAIQLQDRLIFSQSTKISPICVPKTKGLNLIGHQAVVLGWQVASSNSTVGDLIKKDSWIVSHKKCGQNSSRFFCAQFGTPLETLEYNSVGSPVMVALQSGRFIQGGISSWNSLGISSGFVSTPVDIVSNLGNTEISSFINHQSTKAKAKWCKLKSSDSELPKKVSGSSNELKKYKDAPWEKIQSKYRRITKHCKCGIRKSLENVKTRISRGDAAAAHEYPWQVQLLTKLNPKKDTREGCGGALINSKMVLTAAHCLASGSSRKIAKLSDVEVRISRHAGFQKTEPNSMVIGVGNIFVHPKYELENRGIRNDIAVLELNRSLEFSTIKHVSPICIPMTDEIKKSDIVGLDATIIGWGLVNPDKHTSLPEVLQELTVPIKPVQDCINIGKNFGFKIPNEIVCAGHMEYKTQYKDPSHGDSGGPLMVPLSSLPAHGVHNMVQIGVVSAGTYDYVSQDHRAAVWYSGVSDYLPFIDFLSYRAGAEWCSR